MHFGQTNPRAPSTLKLQSYFSVTADMTSATWNTQAKHEIATVTGLVHMVVIPEVTGTLTDAADAAIIQLGHETTTNAFIAATGAAGQGGTTLTAGTIWVDATPTEVFITHETTGTTLDFIIGNGLDVGYEITGAALTGGTIVFHIFWEPISSTGSVTAGAGGVL